MPFFRIFPMFLLVLAAAGARADGALHGPEIISSKHLGYDVQYWIYQPEGFERGLPELYVTDGAAYLGEGRMVAELDREIAAGRITPVAVIFVDSRDPHEPTVDRRYEQFMCNANYARFFIGELMPRVSGRWTSGDPSTRRGLMGLSFGAISAACFGVMAPGVFQVLILQSPGGPEHIDVIDKLYRERPPHKSGFFVSHGGPDDNETATDGFVSTLEERGYRVRRVRTDGEHDWRQWRPLVDDALQAFVGTEPGDRVDGPAPAQ
jgi:enterochelin esterase-like enzyme